MPSVPLRVDPPFCGCGDCFDGRSVPLSAANWQTVKAMLDDEVEDNTGTELIVEAADGERPEPWVLVFPAFQATWPDRQTWQWRQNPWGGRE